MKVERNKNKKLIFLTNNIIKMYQILLNYNKSNNFNHKYDNKHIDQINEKDHKVKYHHQIEE